MARKVTRTITVANVTYQYVDIPNSELKEDTTQITDNVKSETKMLRELCRRFNSSIVQVVKIISVEYETHKYQMLERDFINQAWQVEE